MSASEAMSQLYVATDFGIFLQACYIPLQPGCIEAHHLGPVKIGIVNRPQTCPCMVSCVPFCTT